MGDILCHLYNMAKYTANQALKIFDFKMRMPNLTLRSKDREK